MHLEAYYHHHKAVEYIREHQFDIVHTHLATTTEMYLFPLMAHVHTPHVMTLHSHFPFDRHKAWSGDADKYYMEWVERVPLVCISESACRIIPEPLSIIGVVHHGLDPLLFRPSSLPPAEYFAWLGRIVPEKGAHLAIQAAKRACVPLAIAGFVDKNVQRAVEYFDTIILPQLDGQQISYIGPVDTDEKIRLLSRARGLLNPIQWEEPFGMVMIEALAVGCPVISFARGAAPEIISDQKCGFLVHDVWQMVDAIRNIDEIDRCLVRAYFEERFSSQVMTKNYTKIYEQLIASAREGI